MHITQCWFNCHGGKANPVLKVEGADLICASCHQTVVSSVVIFTDHNVDNFGLASRWENRTTHEVIHDCSEQLVNQMMSELESLTGVR